ncbi:MAG: rRNA maturation RNase YbeY [Alphaproteobacteria bacterium]|nr:rRNA maturation RNase YbeY [Alphaproteobacteria bacterium]
MLDIVVSAPAWRRHVPRLAPFARKVATAAHGMAVAAGKPALTGPVALAFADDAAVRPLNARFRRKDKATNVLSFPSPAGGGDIILALETVAGEAEAQGKRFADHAAHLIAHGILHLMGYDHLSERQARPMESLERAILARFAIADPYA